MAFKEIYAFFGFGMLGGGMFGGGIGPGCTGAGVGGFGSFCFDIFNLFLDAPIFTALILIELTVCALTLE